MTTHTERYFEEMLQILQKIDQDVIEDFVKRLAEVRQHSGRLFLAGLGGSAANCSHAANDFRKLCALDAICMADNVAELTARANDSGWHSIYSGFMQASGAHYEDALLVLSVGGGAGNVSQPLIEAVDYAVSADMQIFGIVGKDGGHVAKHGHAVVIVPTVDYARVTPHTEAFQSVILHLIVSHPFLQVNPTKW